MNPMIDKGEPGEHQHRPALERTAADAVHGLQHDREHRGLEAEEQRRDRRHAAEGGIDVAQGHDRDDAGHHKEPTGHDRPRPAMHQPADIDRQLMGLGSGQQHAVAQRVQEPRLADPFLFVDDDAVHHRDLPGRAAEAQGGDPQPDPEGVNEADAVSGIGLRLLMRTCVHYVFALLVGQLWVSPVASRHQR